MSETIQLTETSRLTIEPDEDAANPRIENSTCVGFVKIHGRGDSRFIDVPAGIEDVHNIADAQSRIERERDVIRWARIFHGLRIEYDATHGGYWWVSMPHYWGPDLPHEPLSSDRQAEIMANEQRAYQQWADGEVCGVILERAKTYAHLPVKSHTDATGLVLDYTKPKITVEWEQADALWGCYLDDEYTAQSVALENFALTEDELAAAGL